MKIRDLLKVIKIINNINRNNFINLSYNLKLVNYCTIVMLIIIILFHLEYYYIVCKKNMFIIINF